MKILKIIIFSIAFFSIEEIVAQDFEVSPASLEYKIDPFETSTKLINITNHSNKATLFKLSYADFIFNIEGQMETVAAKSTENSCMDWLIPDQDVFEINPNESIQLKVSMQVPLEDFKDHWGYIYVQTSKEQTAFSVDKESSSTGLNMQARIAIEVVRTAKTKQIPKMYINDLRELEMDEKDEDDENKRIFTATIENRGSHIYECEVLFIAANLATGEEHNFDVALLKSYPGFPRKVKFTLPEILDEGQYSFVALLDYGNKATLEGARLNKDLIIVK